MKKYLVLYMAPNDLLDEMMKSSTPEQKKNMDSSWSAWIEKHEKSFTDQGSPLGKNIRVRKDGIAHERNELTGYSIIEANSPEEAAKMLQDNPQLDMPGSYIDVVEFFPMNM